MLRGHGPDVFNTTGSMLGLDQQLFQLSIPVVITRPTPCRHAVLQQGQQFTSRDSGMGNAWVVDGYHPDEIRRSKSGGGSKLLGGDGLVKLIKQLHAIDPGMVGDGIFRTRCLVDDIKEIHSLVKEIMVEVVPG